MITFACPECRREHDWADDWAGDSVDCPACGELITLPRARRDDRDDDRYEDRDRDDRRRRFDDDDYRRDGSRRKITCSRCDFTGRPEVVKEMAENAWLFIVLGIFFWPLLIFGLLMKDTWETCPDCGKRLRKVGSSTFG